MSDSILLTGGVGFIGSHIAVEVARAGLRPVLLDNLSNSKRSVVDQLARIIGTPVDFVEGDIAWLTAMASAAEGGVRPRGS